VDATVPEAMPLLRQFNNAPAQPIFLTIGLGFASIARPRGPVVERWIEPFTRLRHFQSISGEARAVGRTLHYRVEGYLRLRHFSISDNHNL
jgi:hypothetical protein